MCYIKTLKELTAILGFLWEEFLEKKVNKIHTHMCAYIFNSSITSYLLL